MHANRLTRFVGMHYGDSGRVGQGNSFELDRRIWRPHLRDRTVQVQGW